MDSAFLPTGTLVMMRRDEFEDTGRVDIRNYAIRLQIAGKEWVVGRIFGRYTAGGAKSVSAEQAAESVTVNFGQSVWGSMMASVTPSEFVAVQPDEWAGLILPDYRKLLEREEVREEVADLLKENR